MLATTIRLVGNLAHAAELAYAADGMPVVTFELVSARHWQARGSTIECAERFAVRFCDPDAEPLFPSLQKGTPAYVIGTLQPWPYTRPDGGEGFALDILADVVVAWIDHWYADAPTLASWQDELDCAFGPESDS
jgi:single-stranded DNA-binding protein